MSKHLHRKGIFFLPPGRDCEVTLHTPLDTLHVHLHTDLFRSSERHGSGQDLDLQPILGDPEGVTCNLLAVLEEILLQGDTSCSLLADSVAYAIANRLIVLNRPDLKNAIPSGRALSSRNVRAVREFVEDHIADGILLTDLATLCGVSCEHFVRTFTSYDLRPTIAASWAGLDAAARRTIELRTGLGRRALSVLIECHGRQPSPS